MVIDFNFEFIRNIFFLVYIFFVDLFMAWKISRFGHFYGIHELFAYCNRCKVGYFVRLIGIIFLTHIYLIIFHYLVLINYTLFLNFVALFFAHLFQTKGIWFFEGLCIDFFFFIYIFLRYNYLFWVISIKAYGFCLLISWNLKSPVFYICNLGI